jgi:hypothetical protein
MTHADVQSWVDKYVDAWRSNGTLELADVFSDNVIYSLSPWKPPLHGLVQLEKFWEKARSEPHEVFELNSEVVAVEDKTAVVRVEVKYANDTPNCWRDVWILVFDKNGACISFEEWPFSPEQNDGQII